MGLITVKDLCWRTVIARLSHALQCFVEKQSTSKLACNKDYTVLSHHQALKKESDETE